MSRMSRRILVLAALVVASGLTLCVALESLDESAQAQSVAEGDPTDEGGK
jgi:hypothetical protein